MNNIPSKEWYTFKKELNNNMEKLINSRDTKIDKDILKLMSSMLKNTQIKKHT
jgi:hypothetical protein